MPVTDAAAFNKLFSEIYHPNRMQRYGESWEDFCTRERAFYASKGWDTHEAALREDEWRSRPIPEIRHCESCGHVLDGDDE